MKRLAILIVLLAACDDPPPGGKSPSSFGEVALPPGFPSTFPIYPGARLAGSARSEANGKRILSATYQTADALDRVSEFYASSRFADYDIRGGAKTPESPLVLRDAKKHLELRLSLAADESGTSIQIKAQPW